MHNKFLVAMCAMITLLFSNVINAAPRYYNIERKPSIEVNLDALERLKLDAPDEIFIPYEEEIPEAKAPKNDSGKSNKSSVKKDQSKKPQKSNKAPKKKVQAKKSQQPKKIVPKKATIWPNEIKKPKDKKVNSASKVQDKAPVKQNRETEANLPKAPAVIVMPEPSESESKQKSNVQEPKAEKQKDLSSPENSLPEIKQPQVQDKISRPEDGLMPPGIVQDDQGKLKDYDKNMDSIRLFEIDEEISKKQSQEPAQKKIEKQSVLPKSSTDSNNVNSNENVENPKSQQDLINLPKFNSSTKNDSPRDVTESIFDDNLPAELPEPKSEEKMPTIKNQNSVQKKSDSPKNENNTHQNQSTKSDPHLTPNSESRHPTQKQSPIKEKDQELPKLPFLNDLSDQKNFSSLNKKSKYSDENSVQSTELVSLGSRFFFDFERKSSKLKNAHKSDLDKISDALINTDGTKISIIGFSKNNKDYSDRRIALQRVIAIRKYMIDKGIDASRLHIKSITPDAQIAEKSSNVEIIFTDLISDFKH